MRPNTGIYWGFWLNLIMSFYFIFVKGLTEGIKNTIMISSIIEKEKEKNDKDISNN
jgi:TRAP-type mannitol/chloroaromatic compound transport system permease small subunit